MQPFSRRTFLVGSLAGLAAGCSQPRAPSPSPSSTPSASSSPGEVVILQVGRQPVDKALLERLCAYARKAGYPARVGLPSVAQFTGENGDKYPDNCLVDAVAMPKLEVQAEGAHARLIGITALRLFDAGALEKTFNQPQGPAPDIDPARIAFWGKDCALLAWEGGSEEELLMLLDQTLARDGTPPQSWTELRANPRKLAP